MCHTGFGKMDYVVTKYQHYKVCQGQLAAQALAKWTMLSPNINTTRFVKGQLAAQASAKWTMHVVTKYQHYKVFSGTTYHTGFGKMDYIVTKK